MALARRASQSFAPLLHGASPAVSPLRGAARSLGSLRDASPAPAPAPRPELTRNQLWLLWQIEEVRASQAARLLELEQDTARLSARLAAAKAAHRDCIAECYMEYARIGFRVVTTVGALGFITLYLLKAQ